MKIPVWILLLIVIVGLIAVYVDLKPRPEPVDPLQKSYDSLLNTVKRQQVYIDSLTNEIKSTDTIIKKEIQYVKIYAENTYKLPADSSVRLFFQWAEMFRDSGARARYLHTDSSGFYK